MSSDTPRTEMTAHFYANSSVFEGYKGMCGFARELERENNALRAKITELEQDKARLKKQFEAAFECMLIGRAWMCVWGDKLSPESIKEFIAHERQAIDAARSKERT